MKKVEVLETIRETRNFEMIYNLEISRAVYLAYDFTQTLELRYLTFDDIIWDYEVEEIMEDLVAFGIDVIQVSDTSTALMKALAAFNKHGFELVKMTTIKTKYEDNKPAIILKRSY